MVHLVIITARKRSLGQGNVLIASVTLSTWVCNTSLSVCVLYLFPKNMYYFHIISGYNNSDSLIVAIIKLLLLYTIYGNSIYYLNFNVYYM